MRRVVVRSVACWLKATSLSPRVATSEFRNAIQSPMVKWTVCETRAARQSYRSMSLYTSLSPCMMCTGTIIQFGIPRLVIGENVTFGGNENFLRERGIEVVIVDDADCKELMRRFIEEKPELWAEDIADE